MSVENWPAFTDQTNARMGVSRKALPEGVAKAFGELAKSAIAPGVLDSKTKELIALGIGIAARCDGCLAFHTRAAKKYGATREEIAETIAVAIYMGGGPSAIYGAEAMNAWDALG